MPTYSQSLRADVRNSWPLQRIKCRDAADISSAGKQTTARRGSECATADTENKTQLSTCRSKVVVVVVVVVVVAVAVVVL